ncbi:MAG: hypothetical protein EOO36_06575 [Cytophagaceae bacterium]|nr:MAG: hypothetical protein EOO36_06575 [Cytophagaceae bacterium]
MNEHSVLKTSDFSLVAQQQRQAWWSATPLERLAAARRLIALGRQLYAANPANPPLEYGRRAASAFTPVSRSRR